MIITIEISDDDVLILENDLLNINAWVQDAVKGKINNCRNRLFMEWTHKLRAERLPLNDTDLINHIVNHRTYKNRNDRN